MGKSTKGHNSWNIFQNFFKSWSGHFFITTNLFIKLRGSSSNSFCDILLTRENAQFTKGHYSCPEAIGPSNFLLTTINLFTCIKLWGSSSNSIWDILLTRKKCSTVQRVITLEIFLEFIQKLTRSSTRHYLSLHQVSRLYLQQFLKYFAEKVKCPKLQKFITHEIFFGIYSKVYQIIYLSLPIYSPSFKVLTSIAFEIFCWQGKNAQIY